MAACNIKECNLDSYEENEQCILHCSKPLSDTPHTTPAILSLFYGHLIDYIVDFIFSKQDENGLFNREKVKKDLLAEGNESGGLLQNSIRDESIIFEDIVFPYTDNRDHFDYAKLMRKVNEVHFIKCTFFIHRLQLTKTKCFFEECTFNSQWKLSNINILESSNDVLYQGCTFNSIVSTTTDLSIRSNITHKLFRDCDFKKSIELYDTQFDSPIFDNSSHGVNNIKKLLIHGCNVNSRFILNK